MLALKPNNWDVVRDAICAVAIATNWPVVMAAKPAVLSPATPVPKATTCSVVNARKPTVVIAPTWAVVSDRNWRVLNTAVCAVVSALT